LHCRGSPPHLRSFPTRRSSDLYAPEAMSEWMRAPTADVKSLRRDLVDRYGEVLSGAEDAGRWFDILDLEADLRSAQYRRVADEADRKSTRLNSSHVKISYAVFC